MQSRQSTKTDDLSELLDALSDPHRREILTRLHARNPRDEDEFELADLIGDDGLENETVSLVHNHLPKLAEAEFIEWDRERQVVARGPRFHEAVPLIDLLTAHEDELPANWP